MTDTFETESEAFCEITAQWARSPRMSWFDIVAERVDRLTLADEYRNGDSISGYLHGMLAEGIQDGRYDSWRSDADLSG